INTSGRAKGVLSYFQLGYEGVSSGEAKLTQIFINAEVSFTKLKKPTENMVDSQLTEEEVRGTEMRDENINVLRTMIKELDHQAKAKATPRNYIYVTLKRNSGSVNDKCFTIRFSLEFPRTSNTRGKTHSTGKGQKGLSKDKEPSRPRRYAKDPTEIHGIKRRQNESLQNFMDRFKSESSHKKGVPPVLRISAFMHGHGHLELAKKLNDKIPKMVDEMFERVRAFIRGEMAPGVYTPYSRRDTFTPLTKTSKEILAMEGISFSEPPPLIGISEKQNLNKLCDYHGDRGHNTDCYQLKKQIEEVVALGKLAHLVRDIRWSNQKSRNQRRNNVKVINMIAGGRNHKRPYEEERSGLTEELTFSAIPQNSLTSEPIVLEGMIEGHQI
ncbi:hypothetical protein Tco_1260493, partial [Tanacetum coccineum]